MANILLPVQIGTLVDNCWPATPQEFAVRLAEIMQAVLDGGQGFYNYGNTKPAPEYQIYPWFRTTDHRWYEYSGDWIAANPVAVGSIERRFVDGDVAAIATYDGGDAGVPSDRTGPMWEIDAVLTGRLAIGSGVIPGRTIAPTTLTAGATQGAGQTAGAPEDTLTEAQLAPHQHTQADGTMRYPGTQKGSSLGNDFTYTPAVQTELAGGTGTPLAAQPHSTLPPVYAGNWVKRSSRIYFRVP